MVWNKTYSDEKRVWGDRPGEAALLAYNYLKQSGQFCDNNDIFVLDLGCGYGRDAVFLANGLPLHILGLDSSKEAIEIARESLPKELEKRIEFLCFDFSHVIDKYDLILVSNLYQLLKPEERAKLRDTVKRCLKADGILILSTLSVRDPQHFGKGTPVKNETNSFVAEHRYIHFCIREELESDLIF